MNLPAVPHRPLARAHSPRRRTHVDGFTLVELMVTVAVAALIIALGAPSFLRAIARHAIQAQAEELQDAVRIGRNADGAGGDGPLTRRVCVNPRAEVAITEGRATCP